MKANMQIPFQPQGPRHRIAAVVLNYCTPELTLQATRSIAEDLDPETDVVIVVDNKSPDDSVEKLKAGLAELDMAHVRLEESPVNGGFAAGNNVGIKAANADAYLLLNSDTIVRPGTMKALWETQKREDHIGLVSPRLEFEDGEPQSSCFRQHSPLSELIEGAQTGPVTQLLKNWDVPLGPQHAAVSVPWTSFACVLIRRSVFETIGLLNEGFFMYYEDADFCRMAKEAGFLVVHQPQGHVVHLRGKSSPVKEATRLLKPRPGYYYEARNRFFRRAYGPLGAVAANSLWTLGRAVALPRELLGLKKRHAVKREFADNWKTVTESAPTRGQSGETLARLKESLHPGEALVPHQASAPPKSEGRLADFYIIGAMKCATSTLHEQLARRSRFFMSDPKEPNFFNDSTLYRREFADYQKLFAGAQPGQIVGESSTHYTKLPTYHSTAERIFEHTPNARLVYVMRDPMGRMGSQFIHEWTERQIQCSYSEAIGWHERFIAYSCYARQLRPYIERFGKERILPVFFEHLVSHREEELERVARFLGDDSDEPYVWHDEAAQTNVSSERLKESFIRDAVLSIDVARRVKDALPDNLRESIKSVWRMKGRPELSDEMTAYAQARFNEDLSELGGLLGLELNCDNFKQIAKQTAAQWARQGDSVSAAE